MGAKKKRQEPSWQDHRRRLRACPISSESGSAQQSWNESSPELVYSNRHDMKCSSCCNNHQIIRENDELTENQNTTENRLQNSYSTSLANSYNFLSRKLSRSLLSSKSNVLIGPLLVFLVIASNNVVQVESVCVWQGGSGFRVACGFRQSGLFRLRSIGGIKGYVGAGFTIGDEDGFKDSLTNTEGQQQPQHPGGYLNPNVHSQRSLVPDSRQNGIIGQYSQINEHALPVPTGDQKLHQYQKIQYLENIQDQLANDHSNLEQTATDQQSQKMLEQQMYIQGMMPPPTQAAKVKGGLTKRASLWNWNPFHRGKGNGNGKSKKKPKHQDFDGPPPPPQRQHQQGPPPQNRRNGPPPPKNRPNQRWNRPGKNGPPPREQSGRRGPRPSKDFRHDSPDSFNHHMKNPFAHLQESFGKQSQEVRRTHFPQDQNYVNKNFAAGNKQFPPVTGSGQKQDFFKQTPGGNMRQQVPQTLMMPPPSPGPSELPKFKKIPNNAAPAPAQDRIDDYDDIRNQPMDNQQPHPPIDRQLTIMPDQEGPMDNPPSMDYYGSHEPHHFAQNGHFAQNDDPAGLRMLKQTENFGTLFHLVNPDGSPVNMQFEKQPVLPQNLQFSSQQQQDLAEELGMPMNNAGDVFGGLGGGGAEVDSLATAVYDPNIFPDIYFTTTEKHQHQDLLQNHNLLPGGYPMSQELLLDNPLLQANQIKRILGSDEAVAAAPNKKQVVRKKQGVAALKSIEQSDGSSTEVPTMIPRRKMRRRKKFRVSQSNNVDTTENDTTGPDSVPVLPKRRRKGRRKKYKLQTVKLDESMASSTERMGLPAGGEQQSSEMKTESPTPDPLTTTPSSISESSSEKKAKSAEKGRNKSGEGKLIKLKNKSAEKGRKKTSFSLPSNEDPSIESASPSSENKIDVSSTTNKTVPEESTTKLPTGYSNFGYFDAVRDNPKNNEDDYDAFSGNSGDFFQAGYDPRFPPDHEVNRGHNMTKFIRPRGPYLRTSSPSSTTSSPFILYDMMGTRNQSRFSSKFHKGNSPFRLDTDEQEMGPDRVGQPVEQHPFFANSNLNQNQKDGVYVKFDSREWPSDQHSRYHKQPDAFSNHYNRTSLSSGYFGNSKEFRPSMEAPGSSLMDWERRLGPSSSTTASPVPVYPGQIPGSSVELHVFGPPKDTFGPPRSTTTPFSPGNSGENKRKLHQNLFGGSSADVSDGGNWASPNYWGNVQQADRYGPSVDFDGNNLKRLLDFGDPNGLKEMAPVDLSSPTPLPMPSPSPQNTMEDFDSPDYFLSPSTPGTRWGKQRRRKGKPTPEPVTPTPHIVSSTMGTTTVRGPTAAALASTTAAPPSKYLAAMSNEVDIPVEFYEPLEPLGLPASPLEIEAKKKGKGKKKSGIEIKFKSGEERDHEEEEANQKEEQNQGQSPFDILGFAPGANGFPGGILNDYDASQGYGNEEKVKKMGMPAMEPGSSEISYFPIVNQEKNVPVPSGPTGLPSSVVFPPMGKFGPPGGPSNQRQIPGYPGHPDRKNFVPSAEDMSHVEPPPSGGLPSHKDNPFKVFEKQKSPVSSGMGFVSTKNEYKQMENTIQRFSTIPDAFLRRDSSEGKLGQAPNSHGDQSGFSGPSAPPPPRGGPSGDPNTIPGFVNIPLPSMEPSPQDSMLHGPPSGPPSGSGYPNDYREAEKGSYAGPPTGLAAYHPSMPAGVNDAPPPPGVVPDKITYPQDGHWEFKPLDNNDVNNEVIPPHEITTRHPILHLDLAGPHPSERRPPPGSQNDMRYPIPISEEGPPHFRGEPEIGHLRPPPPREDHERGPPPPLRDDRGRPPPSHIRDENRQPPPHMRDDRRPPPHLFEDQKQHSPHIKDEHRPPPPHLRDEHRGPPPHLRDEQRGPPLHSPSRDEHRGPPQHTRDEYRGPPPHVHDEHRGPPPHARDEYRGPTPHVHDEHRGPPPYARDEHRGPPPHARDEHRGPPPHSRDEHRVPPHLVRDDPRGPPPHIHDEHRGPPPHLRDEHRGPSPHEHRGPPQHIRDDHKPHKPPPPHFRDDHGRPPPHRDHDRPPPPGRHHEFPRGPPPSGPPSGPPNHREKDRRPFHPERDFPAPPHPPRQDGPPRHIQDNRFRDGPNRGPQAHPPHPPRFEDLGPSGFYPPSREDSSRFDQDRRNFNDKHKVIENLRPPARNQFNAGGNFEHQGDHSSFGTWQEDNMNMNPKAPHGPPTPHGMPKFLDIQKVPKKHDQVPPPNGKKPVPTKVPHQVFKPPPPPPKQNGNFFTNLLTGPGPFGKPHGKPPPPPPGKHRPPPGHNFRPNGGRNPPPNSDQMPDEFLKNPFQDMPPRDPNNYINPFNDRYEPPPPQHGLDSNKKNQPKRPDGRPPFLPFPPASFESSYVDLDKEPHPHLLPPTLVPLPAQDGSLPVREMNSPPKSEPPRPVYKPKGPQQNTNDEKTKLSEAFDTLNNAKYDVIQSLAADKYGPQFIDKLKTKSNMMSSDGQHQFTKLKIETLPVITSTTTPAPKPLFQMLGGLTTKQPTVSDETAKLVELMKMINKPKPVPQQQTSASTMVAGNTGPQPAAPPSDPISTLLQSFSKSGNPPSVTRGSEIPSNPGLVSLTSTLNKAATGDIKSLQAQIAKAIIAKAHRKQLPSEQLEKPHYQPLQISAAAGGPNATPLAVLQQIAQNRQAMLQASTKNYTASQIETLKKLIALNNIEQRLTGPSPTTATSNDGTNDPLKKLQALLPAALTSAKPEFADSLPSNTITRKMLEGTTANSINHNFLQNTDPTLLALKAIALSKAQGVNPQPSIAFPQQVKPTEASSPIAVDLSAILSPSPPVVEMSRKRRLTNVRNAPKSFFPVNATQGFEDFSVPLISEFQCDEQSFFPGLYADTELGCRVFHLCAKTDAGHMMKSFRCPKETVFDQEVLRCNWNLFVDCPASRNKYHFNKYLSQSFQFLKILGEFSANYQKNATMTG